MHGGRQTRGSFGGAVLDPRPFRQLLTLDTFAKSINGHASRSYLTVRPENTLYNAVLCIFTICAVGMVFIVYKKRLCRHLRV